MLTHLRREAGYILIQLSTPRQEELCVVRFRKPSSSLLHGVRAGCTAALLATVALSSVSAAQSPPKKASPPAGIGALPAAVPNPYQLNMLIRTTLIALNQANFTGNYSVLRDLGTPQFQATNSDARLAEIFTPLRRRNVDLSPILFFEPKLVREPMLDDTGAVRITGFIPTSPESVLFDMGFAAVAGHWRLSAIVIDLQHQPVSSRPPNTGNPAETNSKPKSNRSPPPIKHPYRNIVASQPWISELRKRQCEPKRSKKQNR